MSDDNAFKLWFAVCGVVALGMAGLTVWAVVSVVSWLVTK